MIKRLGTINLPLQTCKQAITEHNSHSTPHHGSVSTKSGITVKSQNGPLSASSGKTLPSLKKAKNESSTTSANRALHHDGADTVRQLPKKHFDTIQERQTVRLSGCDIHIPLSPDDFSIYPGGAAGKNIRPQKVPEAPLTNCPKQSFDLHGTEAQNFHITPSPPQHDHRTPEAVEHNGANNCRGQRNAPVTPYPGITGDSQAYMNNDPAGNYCARYAYIPDTVKPETVRIGNQQLITLDTSQPYFSSIPEDVWSTLDIFNFSFLADFLRKNNKIEYIVDIGCGDGRTSLILQNYLNEQEFQIKVIPVDVREDCAGKFASSAEQVPYNIIPAQEIAGAAPATTLFTIIHPFTGGYSKGAKLKNAIAQGKTDYYITTLIKNNPGCFVLTTEDPSLSSPQEFIPSELVYTKHYRVFPEYFPPFNLPLRQAKAAELNAENSDIHRLNQLLAKLPAQRSSYLAWIFTNEKQLSPSFPEGFWPDDSFRSWLKNSLRREGLRDIDSIQSDLKNDGLDVSGWHVYHQGVDASEVAKPVSGSM